MKIKLAVSNERYEEVRSLLTEHGIEIDDDSDLVLREIDRFPGHLTVKDTASNERILLPVEEILYIETFGHIVEVHTQNETYQAPDRLYKIVDLLDPDKFLRISNSVVIARSHVRKISPTLSMKFVLTMSDGKRVDVTRSYYHTFKDYFDI